MEVSETPLNGAYLLRLEKILDTRGYFARAWCQHEFGQHGLNQHMVQLNTAFSYHRGTLRGLHYQIAPHAEAKFVRCTRGAIYDVILDLRRASSTFGKWYGIELSSESGLMLYAPEGFAHGYQTLEDNTEMYYMTSASYAPGSARGVRYDDPQFEIQWALAVSVISIADRTWPDYRESERL